MAQEDTYKTIAAPSTGEYKDRGSKFIAYAFPANEEEDALEKLASLRKEHPKARHHCFAWRFGLDGLRFRANDDGEPSGTAGRPILGQIDSMDLTNVVVVVVRYFGGTLLGASGLIRAYRESTADALNRAVIEERTRNAVFCLRFDYARMSNVLNAVKKLGFPILRQDFGENPGITVAIPFSEKDRSLLRLKAMIGNLHEEEVSDQTEVDGVEFIFLEER